MRSYSKMRLNNKTQLLWVHTSSISLVDLFSQMKCSKPSSPVCNMTEPFVALGSTQFVVSRLIARPALNAILTSVIAEGRASVDVRERESTVISWFELCDAYASACAVGQSVVVFGLPVHLAL